MDCNVGMRYFPDKYFDLAIVDVPYGIGEDGKKNHSRGNRKTKATLYRPYIGNDKQSPDVGYFVELARVSKNQIIWGANHFISKIPFNSSCWVVWDKQRKCDFADCELAWTSFKTSVKLFQFRWNGMLQGDMKNKEKRIHPNQKPVALYKWLLEKYAKPGDKILDTHVGSASSLIAMRKQGFDFVGFELDRYYYKLAQERIKNEFGG